MAHIREVIIIIVVIVVVMVAVVVAVVVVNVGRSVITMDFKTIAKPPIQDPANKSYSSVQRNETVAYNIQL